MTQTQRWVLIVLVAVALTFAGVIAWGVTHRVHHYNNATIVHCTKASDGVESMFKYADFNQSECSQIGGTWTP
jgi:hypothetical protein